MIPGDRSYAWETAPERARRGVGNIRDIAAGMVMTHGVIDAIYTNGQAIAGRMGLQNIEVGPLDLTSSKRAMCQP